jgi:hypothetical protein
LQATAAVVWRTLEGAMSSRGIFLWHGNVLSMAVIMYKCTLTYQHNGTLRKVVSAVTALMKAIFSEQLSLLRKKKSCLVERRLSMQSVYWSHLLFIWLHKFKYARCTTAENRLHILRYRHSHVCIVGIVTRIRTWPKNRSSISRVCGEAYFPQFSRTWGPTILLSKVYLKSNSLPQSSAEIKKGWSCTLLNS